MEPDFLQLPARGQVRRHGPGCKGRILRAGGFVLNRHQAGMPRNEVIAKTGFNDALAQVLAGLFVAKLGLKVRGIQAE